MSGNITCSITPLGNVGNQMIQLMVAKTLEYYSGKIFSYNHLCPDFGYEFNSDRHEELLNSPDTMVMRDHNVYNMEIISEKIRNNEIKNIVIDGYMQKYEYFLDKSFYEDLFHIDPNENDINLSEDEILINIRAGEICNGIWAYPLVPISFYKNLIEKTGYTPVFMGQIDNSLYVNLLKENFPNSKFINSGGAWRDMARIRGASRLCITVSTFSWVNSYLSGAREIYYPILGLFHPNVMNGYYICDVNLLPVKDLRYKYYLFPIIRGDREVEYFENIKKIKNICKEIPKEMALFLSKNKSLISGNNNNKFENVDEKFYLLKYTEAAWEISQGLYKDSQDHYELIGKERGYEPYENLNIDYYENTFRKLSEFSKVNQSSVSKHSRGAFTEDDAKNALSGIIYPDYAFHTEFEKNPWWVVEFKNPESIKAICIYNRRDDLNCSFRIFPLAIEISNNGVDFEEVMQIQETSETVSILKTHNVFLMNFAEGLNCKFLRLIVKKDHEALHLRKIDIYV